MKEKLENRNVTEVTPLIAPRTMKDKLPVTEKAAELVLQSRAAVRDIIHGRDMHKVLVVIGPCSVHDSDMAFDYAQRLKKVADATRDHLVIIMRTYFEKPRTTVGWKGLINDPQLDGSCDIGTGLEMARTLLLRINGVGMPCATEVLDPVTPQYIGDLVSWVAIGARTTESQTHREMASGLSMPVGFKNGTDGSMQVALNAMISARHPHSFLGISPDGLTSLVKTIGNPDRHIVLRGGGGKSNYSSDDIKKAAALVSDEGIVRPVMVDCSHGNANKDYTRQGLVCREVGRQLREGQPAIMGVMIESSLKPGNQTWKENVKLDYGVSITDPCIGWEESETLMLELAEAVKAQGTKKKEAVAK